MSETHKCRANYLQCLYEIMHDTDIKVGQNYGGFGGCVSVSPAVIHSFQHESNMHSLIFWMAIGCCCDPFCPTFVLHIGYSALHSLEPESL